MHSFHLRDVILASYQAYSTAIILPPIYRWRKGCYETRKSRALSSGGLHIFLSPERCGGSPPSPSTLHTAPSQQHLLVSLFPPDWKQFKSRVYVVPFHLEGLAQSPPHVDIQ